MICTDQTDQFLIRLKLKNNYLFIIHDYDANTILGAAISDRKTKLLQIAFTKLFTSIKEKIYKPALIRLNNEILHKYMHLL